MKDEEEQLRRLFHGSVPPLPEPVDRIAAVGARVRRTRTVRMAATTAAAAAVLGVALVAGLAGVLPGRSGAGTSVAGGADSSPLAVSAQTAGCRGQASMTADGAELDRLATQLRSEAEPRFADSFANLEITDRLRVFRKPSGDFDAWVVQEFAAQCVELVDVPYSGRELQQFHDEVEADRSYWRQQGIQLNSLTVGVDGTITIGVDSKVFEKAKEKIPPRYATRVIVQEEGPAPPAIGTAGP